MIQSSSPDGCRDSLVYREQFIDLIPDSLNPSKGINDIEKLIAKHLMSTSKRSLQMLSLKVLRRVFARAFWTQIKGLR
jgi:hypothetical protein